MRTAQRIEGWGTTIKWSHTHDDRIGEMTRSPEKRGGDSTKREKTWDRPGMLTGPKVSASTWVLFPAS